MLSELQYNLGQMSVTEEILKIVTRMVVVFIPGLVLFFPLLWIVLSPGEEGELLLMLYDNIYIYVVLLLYSLVVVIYHQLYKPAEQ